MTIAVLASPEDALMLKKILSTLAKAGVDAYGLMLRPNWESLDREQILGRLEKASHFLTLVSGSSLGSSWFTFTVGYGYSHTVSYTFARFDELCVLPPYVSGLPVLASLSEVESHYKAEMKSWLVQDERRASRATLLEMGISCHNDSLAQCVRDGDTKAVELFLKAGFHPDIRDKYGVPLLCLSARGKHLAVASLLLERGAQLDLQSEDRGYSPLMDAAQAGSADLVKLFLGKGADPNLKSKDGQTALVVAVGRNDAEVAHLLVEGGADPDEADKLGLSARKYAALFKNPAILSLFDASAKA